MQDMTYMQINELFAPFSLDTAQNLQDIFKPLVDIDADLPAQTLKFVITGENPEILLVFQKLPDDQATALLGNPGTYNWYRPNFHINRQQEHMAYHSQNARQKLYGVIFDELDHAQIVRFAKVLEATTKRLNFINFYEQAPVWFLYFIVDALNTTYGVGFKALGQSQNIKSHWTLQKLFELLESEQEGFEQHLLLALFERKNLRSHDFDRLNLLFNLKDTESFLAQYANELIEKIPNLTINGIHIFLDFLQKHGDLYDKLSKLIVRLSLHKTKAISDKASPLLSIIDQNSVQEHMRYFLFSGNSQERSAAAELFARLGQDHAQLLEKALNEEKQKSVQQAIQMALQRLKPSEKTQLEQVKLPDFVALVEKKLPESFTEIILENYQEILTKAEQKALLEIEKNKTSDYQSRHFQNYFKNRTYVKKTNLESVVQQLNGEIERKSFAYDFEIIHYKNRIKEQNNYTIFHALRSFHSERGNLYWEDLFDILTTEQKATLDLKQLADAMHRTKFSQADRLIAQGMLMDEYNMLSHYIVDPEKIWPFFADHQAFLTEALGLTPSLFKDSWQQFNPQKAINVLRYFPQVPSEFIPKLLELALGENKSLRFDAQQALAKIPDIHLQAITALESGKQEVRISAIEWLTRLQNQDAVKPLNTLLNKEKKEIVRAALLTALEKLGQDINAYLKPEVLLKEAEVGLKGKLSVSFKWFDFETLPKVKWQNNTDVDPKIIQWWAILAEKLKEPKANQLLQRYVGLLSEKSQQELANFALQSFITEDTRGPRLDEATEYAVKNAPQRLQQYRNAYQAWAKNDTYYAYYGTITLEEVITEIKNIQLSCILGSAIKSKGFLALAFAAQGSFAVKQIQDFIKQHYTRRAQLEAMISALSISDNPSITQLLLSLSRRYRTASVQTLANTLVAEIAERNQWTSDELADRTIPTAGLDENAVLQLQYGSRNFSAIVDDKDKFILKNEEGKEVKALPAARQNDDESLIKEAKALFSTSKKEFKQVVDMQTGRLYEAMCSERQWNVAEWQEYIFAHPIMRRLIQKLIWLEIKTNGEKISFRPSDDGALLNLDDDEIELSTDSKIQISHAVLVGEKEAKDWIAHFKDYKVKFLFEQMTHHLPKLEDDNVTEIKDHNGWLTDTFTLRGVVTKLGYQRASIEDGGSFDRYTKPYKQLGIDVEITFSGSYVPEENIPAVLYELTFSKKASRSWNNNELPLKQIPPILLAESYADYLKVAASTSGFDPEWEKKTPW